MIEQFINKVLCCRAQELLKLLPSESVDLIVVDPTYGIGYKAGTKTTNGGKKRKASQSFGKDVLQLDWYADAFRVLKPGGAMYHFCDWRKTGDLLQAMTAAKFKIKQRIIWDKMHFGSGDLASYGSQVEDIIFAVKGKHQLRWKKREGNIWKLTKLDTINCEGNFDNPTQKPERLIAKAILRSSDVDDVVLDCFCGSGTTGAAALGLGRKFIMCDESEYQCQIARSRIPTLRVIPPVTELPLWAGMAATS